MKTLITSILPTTCTIWVLVLVLPKEAIGKINEQTSASIYLHRLLDSKVAPNRKVSNVKACFDLCKNTPGCGSSNYDLVGGMCELNNNSHMTHPDYLKPKEGYVYLSVTGEQDTGPEQVPKYRTCAKIQEMNPSSPSGVYELEVNGVSKSVYCDMDNYGGGWSLVVSISASNTDHLLQTEHNCFNTTLCVPLVTGTLPGRKLSDSDIRALAFHEGTFRIDVMTTSTMSYNGFYRLTSGSQFFDSGCHGYWCPRIIYSHVYPYVWESNCNGIEKGYQIAKSSCHKVFDSHDTNECGTNWASSQHFTGKRILYGYCTTNGMFSGLQGHMLVR